MNQISSVKASSFTVAIVTRNKAKSLRRTLKSLVLQTVLPMEVVVVDNGSNDNTKEVTFSFQKDLPLRYLYEKKIGIPFARNRVLREAKGKILAFLDDDCEAHPTWVSSMFQAHRKYDFPIAIQGRSISKPREGIHSIIAQFNRQTLIRDSMLGDRNLYWNWMADKLKKDFEILSCDTRNISIKLDRIRKLQIKFDETMMRGPDNEFGKELLANEQHVILYPKAIVYHYERETLKGFLEQAYSQGQTAAKIAAKWPNEYNPARKRTLLKRTTAFIYYCLVHKYFLKLPLLIVVFLLYWQSFEKGRLSGKVSQFTNLETDLIVA